VGAVVMELAGEIVIIIIIAIVLVEVVVSEEA